MSRSLSHARDYIIATASRVLFIEQEHYYLDNTSVVSDVRLYSSVNVFAGKLKEKEPEKRRDDSELLKSISLQ